MAQAGGLGGIDLGIVDTCGKCNGHVCSLLAE
jgi:hypothetical protein